jgi:hypothetical protein
MPTELLAQRLGSLRWYHGMVNLSAGCSSTSTSPRMTLVREKSSIRDISSVWDVGPGLSAGMTSTRGRTILRHYGGYLVARDGYLVSIRSGSKSLRRSPTAPS